MGKDNVERASNGAGTALLDSEQAARETPPDCLKEAKVKGAPEHAIE